MSKILRSNAMIRSANAINIDNTIRNGFWDQMVEIQGVERFLNSGADVIIYPNPSEMFFGETRAVIATVASVKRQTNLNPSDYWTRIEFAPNSAKIINVSDIESLTNGVYNSKKGSKLTIAFYRN